jgi:hypothetical protein
MLLGKALEVFIYMEHIINELGHSSLKSPFVEISSKAKSDLNILTCRKCCWQINIVTMESHQVIRAALDQVHVKEVAGKLGISLSLLYKWGEESAGISGASNPLDRVTALYEHTQSDAIIQWLCNKADGYFVKNPPTNKKPGREVMPATQQIVQQFADLLAAISHAASDNCITKDEAKHIRQEWDELKRLTERFVKWCEQEDFVHLAEDLKVNRMRKASD